MANSLVRLPLPYVGDFNKGRPLFNAKLFIGEPDLDPEIPANQKTVTGRQEDGTLVTMSQPVRTSSGGYPIYNNAPIELLVDGAYSLKVLDKNDNQTYYFANVEDGKPVTFDDKPVLYRDTVAEAKADVDLTVGMYVTTKGYSSPNDGGGANYIVVAGGTGTDDGGSYHDMANGNQLQLNYDGKNASAKVFGAVGDGVTDDTARIQSLLNFLPSNSTVAFDKGASYRFDTITANKPVTISGGRFISRVVRVKSSDVTVESCDFQAPDYNSGNRAIQCRPYEDGSNYENLSVINCNFNGYFYATDLRARAYNAAESDPANRVLRGVIISGCRSIAPAGQNAGHFQHIGVTSTKCLGCETYNGQNATSYNFINGNADLVVSGCYDENNSYGSIEVENNGVTNGSITGNTFGNDLWIDDSSSITVSGNTCKTLRVTCETQDVRNIVITGNLAERIRVEQFGANPTGLAYDVLIADNQTDGITSGQDIFLGALVTGTVSGNRLTGDGDNSIGIVRTSTTDLIVRNNNGTKSFLVSGSGGTIVEYGNEGMGLISADNKAVHISRMLTPNADWIDLPGIYKSSGLYTGNITSGGTANLTFKVPLGVGLDFRFIGLKVIIRNTSNNNASFFGQNAMHNTVGAVVSLNFGSTFSPIGVNSGDVVLSNNGSTAENVNITVTNNSASTLQVQVIPEFSSRLTETA